MVKVKGIYKLGTYLQGDLIKEEERKKSKHKFLPHYQQFVKRGFGKHKARYKNFNLGGLVLKRDKVNEPKGKYSKF